MKSTVIIPCLIVVGCILTAGCIGQIKNTSANTTVTPVNTFSPLSNLTNMSNTTNSTNTNVPSGLKGPLRVSIGGWDAELPVSVDNVSVGVVTKDKPLDLMLPEGNHTVQVCTGIICEEQNVTVRFAKQGVVDFEESLIKDAEFPKPTAQIIGFNPSGSTISVNVEFINPSAQDLSMSAEVKCAYTYIDSRSNNRVGGSGQGIISATVPKGQRVTQTLYIYLADGYSYIYSTPVISGITVR
jgi:hypothetical protein